MGGMLVGVGMVGVLVVVMRFTIGEERDGNTHNEQERTESCLTIGFEEGADTIGLCAQDKHQRQERVGKAFTQDIAYATNYDSSTIAYVAAQIGESGHVRAKRTGGEHRKQTKKKSSKQREGGIM